MPMGGAAAHEGRGRNWGCVVHIIGVGLWGVARMQRHLGWMYVDDRAVDAVRESIAHPPSVTRVPLAWWSMHPGNGDTWFTDDAA